MVKNQLFSNLLEVEGGDFPYRLFEEDITCSKENGCKRDKEFYIKSEVKKPNLDGSKIEEEIPSDEDDLDDEDKEDYEDDDGSSDDLPIASIYNNEVTFMDRILKDKDFKTTPHRKG